MSRKLNGWIGTAGLVLYIVGWDTYAIKCGHETISEACWRAGPAATGVVGIVLAAAVKHLLLPKFWPASDPISLCGKLIRKL